MLIYIRMFALTATLTGMAGLLAAQSFTLPKLPYAYDALEPHIDAQTMEIHHSRHHQGYVNNLNKALEGSKSANLAIGDLLIAAGRRGTAVRNNGGGHYNHTLFWDILSPKPKAKPEGALATAINQHFGSVDSLKTLLNQAAATRFGSGWAWLVVTPDKKLAVTSTPNQDNPLMDVADLRGVPIIGIDVWEHAYYLKYQNKRGDYLGAIWNVLDWAKVEQHYAAALTSPLMAAIEKDNWKALSEFHKVMAATFHPMEEGNLQPIRERNVELLAKARELKGSAIPAPFDTPEIKTAIDELVNGSAELMRIIRKRSPDAEIVKQLTAVHDTFHKIQGLCSH